MMVSFFKILSVVVISVFINGDLWAVPQVAFKSGEKLTFMVSYRARLVPNTDVALVVLSVEDDVYNSTAALRINATGDVMPFFKWFFDLHDKYSTWIDPVTLKPMYSTCDIREGNYRFSSRLSFDWTKYQVYTSYRNLKRPHESHKTMPLSEFSYDGLSLFYNLRSTVPNELLKGQVQQMSLVIEDTIRTINYRFLGHEKRKIKNLGEFRTLKFSCQLATTNGEAFADGTEFFLWISDDKNRIPLYIESPIRVGSVRAHLMNYSNLKYPLDSKIK